MEGAEGGICARNGRLGHTALAFKDHWGLQRLGLLEGGLSGCLQPRKGSGMEDSLPSAVTAVGREMGWGHPGICLLQDPRLPTPERALPFRCPLCQAPLLLGAQEKRTGEKQGGRLVWLVTNAPGLLPVCPLGSPREAAAQPPCPPCCQPCAPLTPAP